MGGQMLLFTALSIAVIGLAVVMAMFLLRLRKSVDFLERRADEAIRQFELTAEDLRKTNAVAREILLSAERSVANVEHVTEGARRFRKTMDMASTVMEYAFNPVLGTMAGGLAGIKAAASHLVNRFVRKETDNV